MAILTPDCTSLGNKAEQNTTTAVGEPHSIIVRNHRYASYYDNVLQFSHELKRLPLVRNAKFKCSFVCDASRL